MSTTAAFFVGEGEHARFLGGHYSDGYIQEEEDQNRGGIPPSLLQSSTQEEFERRVGEHMQKVSEDDRMEKTLSWPMAKGVQYIYCFFEDHVWVTSGGRWYNDYIPANIQPSKRTPSAPVCIVGKLGIDVMVECGQCRNTERLDHQEFEKQHSPGGWSLGDIYAYFESKGWKRNEAQGWLCGGCGQ